MTTPSAGASRGTSFRTGFAPRSYASRGSVVVVVAIVATVLATTTPAQTRSWLAVGLHANAVHRGWIVNKLELELEGDLNITAVWGTGDVSEKPVGFTDVRVKVDMECEWFSKSEIDALVDHVKKWSPVANTFTRPVNLEVIA